MIYLANQFLEVDYDTENPIVITDSPTRSTKRNRCNGRARTTRDTFLRPSHAKNDSEGQKVNWENFIRFISSTAICMG